MQCTRVVLNGKAPSPVGGARLLAAAVIPVETLISATGSTCIAAASPLAKMVTELSMAGQPISTSRT